MQIRLEDVHYAYRPDQPALRGLTLVIEPGEQVALAGPNGSGKSTLARCLNGLVQPQRGQVWVGDWNTRRQPVFAMAQRVAYVFQNPDEQLCQRTVADEVAFGPRQLCRPAAACQAAVVEALDWTGLSAQARAHPYDLGLSDRKLVAVASALAMEAPILVLDEPTAGLDGFQLRRLERLLAEQRRRGTTVLVITHDLDFAAENLDRLVRLSAGQVAQTTPLLTAWAAAAEDPFAPQMARLAGQLGLTGPVRTPAALVEQITSTGRAGASPPARALRSKRGAIT